jgi:predicted metalloprotease with PDZ domain
MENFALRDRNGGAISSRRIASGAYTAEREARVFEYDVKLSIPTRNDDASHVSWANENCGLLVIGDLLPQISQGDRSWQIELEVPDGWSIATAENKVGPSRFQITDAENAVFFVGQNLQETTERVDGFDLTVAMMPEQWAFTLREAAEAARNIYREARRMVNATPRKRRALVMLASFPRPAAADQWSAETRGTTVVFVGGRSPAKVIALAQLGVTLAHEMFHLWVPNGLHLSGEYDWFYEGFTLYQSVRLAQQLQYLTFQDYLNAVGRAYDKYRQARGASEDLSLLEASRRRWNDQALYVYHKGMVVAFLYDLTLRHKSNGKLNLDDVYRDLFQTHGASENSTDGNQATLALLGRQGGMSQFTHDYIENAGRIDLASALSAFGLTVTDYGARTDLRVAENLSKQQSKILGQFGYSEKDAIWHRRLQKSKSR